MSHQFKSGDLALTLVGDEKYPAMTEVELLAFLRPGDTFTLGRMKLPLIKACWHCRSKYWEMVFRSEDLMPLRSDFCPERQKAEEAEPCA